MGVAVLQGAVQPAQVVAVGPRLRVAVTLGVLPVAGGRRPGARVQNRLVVFVHQHRDALAGALVQRLEQVREAPRERGGLRGRQPGPALGRGELPHDTRLELARALEVAPREAQPHDGAAARPVPGVVHREPPEQRLAALVQLLQRVHEQALAEPARARQEEPCLPPSSASRPA